MAMTMKHKISLSKLNDQALYWHGRMQDQDVTLEECFAFEAWLDESPSHKRFYDLQQATLNAVPTMEESLRTAYLQEPGPLEPKKEQHFLQALFLRISTVLNPVRVVVAAGAVAVFLLMLNSGQLWTEVRHYQTKTAEIKELMLSDGSIITLGAASEMEVSDGSNERRVKLIQGEAFFDIEKAAEHPFRVETDKAVVRVLGTRFDVHHGVEGVRVAVADGRVEVSHVLSSQPENAELKRVLKRGDEILVHPDKPLGPVREIDAGKIAAWRDGQMIYVRQSLKEVIADVARYYPAHIAFDDEAIAKLEITAAFRVDNLERMFELLETILPVKVDHLAGGNILIRES